MIDLVLQVPQAVSPLIIPQLFKGRRSATRLGRQGFGRRRHTLDGVYLVFDSMQLVAGRSKTNGSVAQ